MSAVELRQVGGILFCETLPPAYFAQFVDGRLVYLLFGYAPVVLLQIHKTATVGLVKQHFLVDLAHPALLAELRLRVVVPVGFGVLTVQVVIEVH